MVATETIQDESDFLCGSVTWLETTRISKGIINLQSQLPKSSCGSFDRDLDHTYELWNCGTEGGREKLTVQLLF